MTARLEGEPLHSSAYDLYYMVSLGDIPALRAALRP